MAGAVVTGRLLRLLSAVLTVLALCSAPARPDMAAEAQYLRIGTGPPGESYFQVGGLIATALTSPPGAPFCRKRGPCGIPGVIASALATNGSASNAQALCNRTLDVGLVLSDIALWVDTGAAPFQSRTATPLATIGALYPAQMQLVVRADSRIASPKDLKGKRVSLGIKGSGTLLHARQLLAAWSLSEADLKPSYMGPAEAADTMLAGSLDAFFLVDAAPVPSVVELAKVLPIALVPLRGDPIDRLRRANTLLGPARIPAGTYSGQTEDVATLDIRLMLVVAADMPDDLAYAIAEVMWNPATLDRLSQSLPQGVAISPDQAMIGLGLPLHAGAVRYFQDAGLMRR